MRRSAETTIPKFGGARDAPPSGGLPTARQGRTREHSASPPERVRPLRARGPARSAGRSSRPSRGRGRAHTDRASAVNSPCPDGFPAHGTDDRRPPAFVGRVLAQSSRGLRAGAWAGLWGRPRSRFTGARAVGTVTSCVRDARAGLVRCRARGLGHLTFAGSCARRGRCRQHRPSRT
jgi:hypothetical protein